MIPYPAPTLTTERLTLRARRASDAVASMLDLCIYEGRFARDEAEGRAMLEQNAEDGRAGNTIHWLIFRGDTLIGVCGFYRGFADATGEVGYALREAHRGQGFMSEAVRALIRFAGEGLGLRRVIADTAPSNAPSVRLLTRLGFRAGPIANGYQRFTLELGEDP